MMRARKGWTGVFVLVRGGNMAGGNNKRCQMWDTRTCWEYSEFLGFLQCCFFLLLLVDPSDPWRRFLVMMFGLWSAGKGGVATIVVLLDEACF